MGVRKQLRAMQWSWGKLAILASWAVVGGVAFYLGRVALTPQAVAAPNTPVVRAQESPAPAPAADAKGRVLAYIHGNVPITRDELAEYLIARQGADRLPLLINRRIIEIACQKANVVVAEQEVEDALTVDLKALQCDRTQFTNTILKQYHKTLFEWKEDVIRPRLMLTKLCRNRVNVTEQDLANAFEAHFGEKVEGRLILWPRGEEKFAQKAYGDLRSSEEKFAAMAREQATPTLASTGGKIRPISRHSTGTPDLEKAALSLQPGQITELVGTPEGVVVFKCDKRIPADATKKLEDVRNLLEQEILAKKTNAEFQKYFEELRVAANPVNLMMPDKPSQADRERDVEQLLKEGQAPTPKGPASLNGN